MADNNSPNDNMQPYADMGNPISDVREETTTVTETYATSLICDGNNAIYIAHDQNRQPLTFEPQSQPPVHNNNPTLDFDIFQDMDMDQEADDENDSDSDGGAPLFQDSESDMESHSHSDEDEAMLDGDADDEDSDYEPEIMNPVPIINPPNQGGAPLHNNSDGSYDDSTTMMVTAQANDEVGNDTISTISSILSDIEDASPPPPTPQPSN
jgi:hypothetical protein